MRESFSVAVCRANARHGGEVRFEYSLTVCDAVTAANNIACCNSAGLLDHLGRNCKISTPDRSTDVAISDSSDKPQNQQQHDCTDRSADNDAHHADSQMNTESRQQPSADEGAQDAHDNVPDKAHAAASDKRTGEPTCHGANHEPDKKGFALHFDLPNDAPVGKMLRAA
jgi:hypothetical protein